MPHRGENIDYVTVLIPVHISSYSSDISGARSRTKYYIIPIEIVQYDYVHIHHAQLKG